MKFLLTVIALLLFGILFFMMFGWLGTAVAIIFIVKNFWWVVVACVGIAFTLAVGRGKDWNQS